MDNKYKSISSILREMSANRNSELRKKVVNVARPENADPTSEKSKLSKQAEIKTKIIDEEQVEEANKKDNSPEHQARLKDLTALVNKIDTKKKTSSTQKDADDHEAWREKRAAALKGRNYHEETEVNEVIGDVGPNQGPLDEINVGDTVHAGFGKKGGAGFKGKVHKVDGDDVHINIGKGKYGDRIVKAPKRLVTKEEVVVEASVSAINKDDIETNKKDVDAPETKDKKEKKSDKNAVDAKEVKGGKTEVELNPRTNDNNVDQDQEDGESKKARKAANKEIGAKGIKESFSDEELAFIDSVINEDGNAPIVSKQGYRTVVGKQFQEPFQKTVDYIDARKMPLDKPTKDSYPLSGTQIKNIKGTDVPSIHSHGGALDINPKTNPVVYKNQMKTTPPRTTIPRDVVDFAKSQGLGYGGEWKSKYDPMHFSTAPRERGIYTDKGAVNKDALSKVKDRENKSAMKSAEYTGDDPTTKNFNLKGIAMAKAAGKTGADLPLEIGRKMSSSEIETRGKQAAGLSGPQPYNAGAKPTSSTPNVKSAPKSSDTPKPTSSASNAAAPKSDTPKPRSEIGKQFDAEYAAAKKQGQKIFTFRGGTYKTEETTMFKSDNTFGLPQGLLDSVQKILDEKKQMSKADIAALEEPKGKIDHKDLAALRAGKHKVKEEYIDYSGDVYGTKAGKKAPPSGITPDYKTPETVKFPDKIPLPPERPKTTIKGKPAIIDKVQKVGEEVENIDEKSLAALAPPYDKVTHKDVLVGRGVLKKHPSNPSKHVVAKEEVEQVDEKLSHKLKDRVDALHANLQGGYDHDKKSTYGKLFRNDAAKISKTIRKDSGSAVQKAAHKSYHKEEVELSSEELARIEAIAKDME